MRLVQLVHETLGRKVALVEEPNVRVLINFTSVYKIATSAIKAGGTLTKIILENRSDELLDYDSIYEGKSEWKLLPAFDHPTDVTKLMLAGTGLTHKASAENRQKMHEAESESELTDSMKMYLMGVEGGHPKEGEIGIQPEWFYKGNCSVLRAHNDDLTIPDYGDDGGEEPEIAGIYINDSNGSPWRIGFATANEFSDHVMERKNYLYLAPSKIRNCSLGPELVITDDFSDIEGTVRIIRNGAVLWEKTIRTGEVNMSHSLNNLEYHHFKYANHRIPDLGHIHFFGADAFSFGEKITLKNGDIMEIHWKNMGRPLKNRLTISEKEEFTISHFR
ncbi:AraD1 family protein [Maribacter halichondriae]|uniref:AraD1 family protein n=1 Tax=Maribacter halichondriae TaxID=2980554 RepID=UPI0023587566|nr:AraD1 family protein [Maribacter sp. Hal144]